MLGWCVEGSKIVELCQKGDQLLEEEIAKVYKGKKIQKGMFPLLVRRNQCQISELT